MLSERSNVRDIYVCPGICEPLFPTSVTSKCVLVSVNRFPQLFTSSVLSVCAPVIWLLSYESLGPVEILLWTLTCHLANTPPRWTQAAGLCLLFGSVPRVPPSDQSASSVVVYLELISSFYGVWFKVRSPWGCLWFPVILDHSLFNHFYRPRCGWPVGGTQNALSTLSDSVLCFRIHVLLCLSVLHSEKIPANFLSLPQDSAF